MKKYEIFHRTWYKVDPETKRLIPHIGRKTHIGYAYGIDDARKQCEEWNSQNDPGVRQRKAEFQSV